MIEELDEMIIEEVEEIPADAVVLTDKEVSDLGIEYVEEETDLVIDEPEEDSTDEEKESGE